MMDSSRRIARPRTTGISVAMVCWIVLSSLAVSSTRVNGFSIVLMARRGKGDLKNILKGESGSTRRSKSVPNQGKGQEITGVTLPAEGTIKGWEFGDRVTMVCANVDGRFLALQGNCPKCGFDLWRGDLIVDDPGFADLVPLVACPTCSTTFSLESGKYGPPLKRTGLAGFVSGLAKSATAGDKPKNAESFAISLDDDGRVYCRKRNK